MKDSHKKTLFIVLLSIIVTLVIVGGIALTIHFINDYRAEGPYNEEDFLYQEAADDEYEEMVEEYLEEYPIATELPIIMVNWRIDYGLCETSDGEFCVMITAVNDEYRNKALEVLRGLENYEEGKYTIEFFSDLE
jgi:hypothetical protein